MFESSTPSELITQNERENNQLFKTKRKKSLKSSTLLWLLVKKDIKEIFEHSDFKYAHPKKRKKFKCCGIGLYSKRDLALNDDTFLEHV
jgi:hypothetical protein